MPEQQLTSYKDRDQALNLANGNKIRKETRNITRGFREQHARTDRQEIATVMLK
jgi:hypothetical protein